MRGPGNPTLDQLQVLLAVAEAGSFTEAARRLGRAVSAISYATDTLEAQLGVSLFARGTTRKPRLTEAGEAILSEARAVVLSIDTLRARVKGLNDGLESEVSLVVDSMFQGDHLIAALADFHGTFPTVPLRLLVKPLNGVERALRRGDAGIGVGSPLHMDVTGLRLLAFSGVPLVAVAAPNHPLAMAGVSPARALDHVQLVLMDQRAEGRDLGVVSQAVWRVGDLNLKLQMILRGIGWGGMPEPMVRADIEAGRLVLLDLDDYRAGEYMLRVAYKIETPPGPAGRWLIDRLR
ncbi:MAG TPA: LysR family transcriptional regulator [Caulobacteraceae bacterium]|jgi:DNA-binding transcriptional LysR family regulator